MRTIKFRAQGRGDYFSAGVWFYWDAFGNWIGDAPDRGKLDLETLGQFTGLHDKNGKEIWEGDVVRDHAWPTFPFGKIVFKNGAFRIKQGGGDIYAPWQREEKHIEVLGNIYESPELLKP